MTRIVRRLEYALLQLEIEFLEFVLLVLQQLLEIRLVFRDGLACGE